MQNLYLNFPVKWLNNGTQPTPVSLPRQSYGQRTLVGCSPWGRKELDMTEQLTLTYLPHSINLYEGRRVQVMLSAT